MKLWEWFHEWQWQVRSKIYFGFFQALYSLRKIQKNKIVVVSYYGADYGDNGKYIVEELRKRGRDLDIVWLLKKELLGRHHLPQGVRAVEYRSPRSIYELQTAGVWIDNSRKIYGRKRKGQLYIQTWHGDIGNKRIEQDVEKALSPYYVKNARKDSRMADLMISGNAWFTGKLQTIFWYDGEVLPCGYPRRDILYREQDFREALKARMGIPAGARVFFYAPTFRKDQEKLGVSTFALDWQQLLEALQARFGGQWAGILRLHPNISHMAKLLTLPEGVYDMTAYPDMQELLAVSDICMSDYSSSAFEFGVTGKPAFIFARDLELYRQDRDLHFDFDKVPFPMAESEEALRQNIHSFDAEAYAEKCRRFYGEVLGMYPEGNASQILADRIEAAIFGEEN